jgi:hypothetical protein
MSRLLAAIVAGVLLTQPTSAQSTSVDQLLARSATYVESFLTAFANIVAEERYTQVAGRFDPTSRGVTRFLVSDYLVVRLPSGELSEFRDVLTVDTKTVHGRNERLLNLFIDPRPDAIEQAEAIANEGARFLLRTGRQAYLVSTPIAALAILQPRYADRFRFTLGNVDRQVGPGARIIRFEEQVRPTVFRDDGARDQVARGRFWVLGDTGRVVQSELLVGLASITTTFRFDEALGMDVPAGMTTQHRFGSVQSEVRGTATYGRFRRFRVAIDEALR